MGGTCVRYAKQVPMQLTTSRNFQGWYLPLPFAVLWGEANLLDVSSTWSYSLQLPNKPLGALARPTRHLFLRTCALDVVWNYFVCFPEMISRVLFLCVCVCLCSLWQDALRLFNHRAQRVLRILEFWRYLDVLANVSKWSVF